MKAIILAAGRGSRMNEGTAALPKCMMTLWGKTLLEMCVETLGQAGFAADQIGIVTGYRSDQIRVEGAHYFHNDEWENTNMFVSLTKASAWLRAEPCIVCYSDIIFHENAVKKLMETEDALAVTYYSGFLSLWQKRFENPLEDVESFRMDSDGYLTEIGLQPQTLEEIQGQYMGLLRFTPKSWAAVEQAIRQPMRKTVQKLDMTTLLNHLIGLGSRIRALRTDERWLECDNQKDIALYEKVYTTYD